MEHFLSTLKHAETTHCSQHMILDLNQVNFIDNMAIEQIVTTCQQLNQTSIRFTLASHCGEVDTNLKDINFEGIVPTIATVEQALALPLWQHSL